jgi:hypothetical protein
VSPRVLGDTEARPHSFVVMAPTHNDKCPNSTPPKLKGIPSLVIPEACIGGGCHNPLLLSRAAGVLRRRWRGDVTAGQKVSLATRVKHSDFKVEGHYWHDLVSALCGYRGMVTVFIVPRRSTPPTFQRGQTSDIGTAKSSTRRSRTMDLSVTAPGKREPQFARRAHSTLEYRNS